ncbi:hypothetical protein HDU96_000066 [Phlyctochytrium bullatum]|nr:hypothetical protein HDU96_000066 [Phlyctochytrium bullatum]
MPLLSANLIGPSFPSPTKSIRWFVSTALRLLVLLLLSQKSSDRAYKVQPYIIADPFFEFPTPKIRWIDPRTLVPHENTSQSHLLALINHLYTLNPSAPLPIPVCTESEPRIILDGHHRVAASIALGLSRIPVWVVDDEEEKRDWDNALIKVYARSDGERMRLEEVVTGARRGRVEWGIKGTRHVAVVSSDGKEVTLERVTPRIEWGIWASGGRPCGKFWHDWDRRLVRPNVSTTNETAEMELSGVDPALDSAAEIVPLSPLEEVPEEVSSSGTSSSAQPTSTTASQTRGLGLDAIIEAIRASVVAPVHSFLLSALPSRPFLSSPLVREAGKDDAAGQRIATPLNNIHPRTPILNGQFKAAERNDQVTADMQAPASTVSLKQTTASAGFAGESCTQSSLLSASFTLPVGPIQTLVASLYTVAASAVSSLAATLATSVPVVSRNEVSSNAEASSTAASSDHGDVSRSQL